MTKVAPPPFVIGQPVWLRSARIASQLAEKLDTPTPRQGPHVVTGVADGAVWLDLVDDSGLWHEQVKLDLDLIRAETTLEKHNRISAQNEPWRALRDANLRAVFAPARRR